MDAVPDSSIDHTQRIRTLHTTDGSPSKQPADASKGAAGARKKQHSTPPIKDVRCSSLCAPACSMPVFTSLAHRSISYADLCFVCMALQWLLTWHLICLVLIQFLSLTS